MSRQLKTWIEIIFGGILVGGIILSLVGLIVESLGIYIYFVLVIPVSVISFGVFLNSNWWRRHQRCEHGVWAGSRGRCQISQAKVVRLQKQREADLPKWKQQ